MRRSTEIETVSSAAARDLYQTCQQLDLLSDECLMDMQISNDTFSDLERRIPEQVLISLWQRLAVHHGHSDVGLRLGQTIDPESKGILASWVSQTGTLREALSIFFNNIALMNPSEHWQLQETNTCRLNFNFKQQKDYPNIAIERSMSAMVFWARALSGGNFTIEKATFVFPKPEYADAYTPIFGTCITFESDKNSLLFDSDQLEKKVVNGNQWLKSMVEAKAHHRLANTSSRPNVTDTIKNILDEKISYGQPVTIQHISDMLAVSRQTLYRQLKQENTDFQTLLDTARKEHALTLLNRDEASIQNVSIQLGFKDTNSFYKAFRRWTGSSPRQYCESLDSKPKS